MLYSTPCVSFVYSFGVYRIVGNFGEVLIWRFGEFGKDGQIKNSAVRIIACMPMALRIQIAKLNIHQYLLRANLPNLMLAKFSRYTVDAHHTVKHHVLYRNPH